MHPKGGRKGQRRLHSLDEKCRINFEPGILKSKVWKLKVILEEHGANLLGFGYLGKWSPCAYESLSTKGETFTLVLCTLCLLSL
jgi:hypothetical protein